MLYQKNTGKLRPKWRGPFMIDDYGSERQLSYRLRQLHGRRIKGKLHGASLARFTNTVGVLFPLLTDLPGVSFICKMSQSGTSYIKKELNPLKGD